MNDTITLSLPELLALAHSGEIPDEGVNVVIAPEPQQSELVAAIGEIDDLGYHVDQDGGLVKIKP